MLFPAIGESVRRGCRTSGGSSIDELVTLTERSVTTTISGNIDDKKTQLFLAKSPGGKGDANLRRDANE
jgi:hypothetical protein